VVPEEHNLLDKLPASPGFMLGLFFNPVDGGDIFLQNIQLSPKYVALQPRKPYSSRLTEQVLQYIT
jgi:hypothetical protein